MALDIKTRPAVLTTNVSKPIHSIEQPKAKWNGSITMSSVKVEGTLAKVTIDQEAAFNESGIKNNEAFLQDSVSYALQKMSEGVSRRTSQGDQFAKISQGGNPIAEQALQNAFGQFQHEFGMVTMPRSGAQIDVVEGTLDIQVTDGGLEGGYEPGKVIVDYQAGKVERSMEQYNSITIKYIGESLDLKV